MARDLSSGSPEVQIAFLENEQHVRIQNYRLACVVAMVMMPVAFTLDYIVYPEHTSYFFVLRLLCSAALFFIWRLIQKPLGQEYHQLLGMLLPGLPSLCTACMIFETTGAESPYYAGLNLVLLGAAILLRWTVATSVMVCAEVTVLYLAACWMHTWLHRSPAPFDFRIFYNNVYFLLVTCIFVVISSYYYNRLRFSEFALRFELDKNRQQLEEKNKKLRELDQAKSRLFANISHELRTPLTLLLAPLERLIERFRNADNDELIETLAVMHANGMRLLKLINDLLDLVRLESGRTEVRRENVAMDGFFAGLSSAVRQVARDKGIALETRVDAALGVVSIDRDKLEKVVLNLVFNAIKFTSSGGRVEVRAGREGDEIVIAVSDTGIGISESNLPHVFDRFWQADDSSRRKHQGTGIGLSLVKELVEVQGGTVTVESVEGEGTTFTVRLPYAKVPVESPVSGPAVGSEAPVSTSVGGAGEGASVDGLAGVGGADPVSGEWLAGLYRRAEFFPATGGLIAAGSGHGMPGSSGAPRLLIADDEPDMLRFLRSLLNGTYEVHEAVDGERAVENARRLRPDIILLDMMMPGKDGLQVCRELRSEAGMKTVPIVMLTARADEETKLVALEAGANDFLSKPFSGSELHARLKNLTASHRFQQALARQNDVLAATLQQLKEAETQLVQAAKMASLGRMSAGIIHEINNPLNFVTQGLYLLRTKGGLLPENQKGEFGETIKDIEDGLKRVRNIVSDLRTFTHPDAEHKDQVDVSEVVSLALRFLSNQLQGQVQVRVQIPEDQTVLANKNRLVQVVLNLVQNSLDALRRKPVNGEPPGIDIIGRVTPGSSRLVIRDNGEGIAPEHRDKIFDPFFTTKDVGEGMGLGLSICYRIVRESGGQIHVRSEPGQFAEFELEFPDTNNGWASTAIQSN